MSKLPNWLYDFFYYTKSERVGLTLLLGLCSAMLVVISYWPQLTQKPDLPDTAIVQQQIAQKIREKEANQQPYEDAYAKEDTPAKAFHFDPNTASEGTLLSLGLPPHTVKSIVKYRTKGGHFYKADDLSKIYTLSKADFERLRPYITTENKVTHQKQNEPFLKEKTIAQPTGKLLEFDPNTASEAELIALGLPQKTVSTLLKYREKGGRFRTADDLKKIYALSPTDAERLAPYVRIASAATAKGGLASAAQPANIPKAYNAPMGRLKSATASIDINKSTADDWKTLPGIGETYAQRIIKYRDKLGGFATAAQVSETFGLPDSIFQRIVPQLKTSPINKKIAVNTATVEELKIHPYIGNKQADAIMRYRANHGRVSSIADLQKLPAFDAGTLQKLSPYLSFE